MAQLKTMRSKLVRIMLLISGLTGVATFVTVAMISAQTSARHLTVVQKHIEEGIASKGKVLTQNHALALRGLIQDNAFLDIQRLVDRAVREDADLVYGVVVSSEQETLALSQRGANNAGAADSDPKAPPREAWRELGLISDEVLLKRESVQRVARLGQDLLEVAVPVTGDEGEPLGTIRYALSTRPMHEALARAEAEKSDGLLTSVSWIAMLVGLTTFTGWLLSRGQAFRITSPVGELTQAAEALALGKRTVRVNITSGDELELLGSSFNHMVEELDASYRELENANRTLEQKVDARTLELGLKNRDMRLVLDNVDQGFLMLSPEGRVMGGRSRVLSEWFGECPDQIEFAEYIGRTSQRFGEAFHCGWFQIVDAILPLELTIDQLPTTLTSTGRTWSLRYLPFVEADILQGVLVVAAEITERLARDREDAEQRELMQSFSRLMRDRRGFMDFVDEADGMVSQICSRSIDYQPVALKSRLHTLKGTAAAMGLSVVASHCHTLEEQLQAGDGTSQDTLSELQVHWGRIKAHVLGFVPGESQRMIEVPASEYETLVARLSAEGSPAELLAQVRGWALEPAVCPLERLGEQAKALGRRLGKGELEVVVNAAGVRLDPALWRPFFTELVHLIRNAVDHGIEAPDEREQRGKSAGGRLVLAAHAEDDVLSFEVSDDGRGIDWDLIRTRGESLGLPHSAPGELLRVLCHPGVTTRGEVSDTSGRGMGMAAFERCVRRMEGRMEVESSDLGTRWIIRFAVAASAHGEPSSGLYIVRSESGMGLPLAAG